MLYDPTYYLWQVVQAFLQANPALQDERERAVLSCQDETLSAANDQLRLRLLAWLETQSSLITHQTALLHIADAGLALGAWNDTVSGVMMSRSS